MRERVTEDVITQLLHVLRIRLRSDLLAMIDLHCHLLPGVDDGAHHLEEALEMCRLALGLTSMVGPYWPILILGFLGALLIWYFVSAYRAR